jgi:RNA methyltransferase, TrmH family
VKANELTISGLAAVRARFERDASSIKRLFFDPATGRKIGPICQALAQARKVYRCVEPVELEKIAGSVHHGGIVAVVDAPALRRPLATDLRAAAMRREPWLVLDRIGNPHNLGAIVRTAAFFGLRRIVIPDDPSAARPNDAAYRVAEGAFEQIEVWSAPRIVALIRDLKSAGYEVVGAATRGGRPEVGVTPTRPIALVLGNEEHGLAPEVMAACTRLVTLPGSGAVESLNVSVAAAVLIWEFFGRQPRQ